MASPFDALFGAPTPPAKAKRRTATVRHIQVVKGVCQRCMRPGVFWSSPPGPYVLCELQDDQAIRHTCTPVEKFDVTE